MEVRYEYLMPREIEAAMSKNPTLYMPLGTIEWHGFHNAVGLDSLKAHALCVDAARQGGGIVHPALYGGVGGLNEPHTFIFDPENSIGSIYLRPWLEQTCREAVRNGFKAIIILTGHYGAAQQIVVRETAVRMTKILNIPIYGGPEYFLALDEEYYGDHAGAFETSFMMHYHPDLVAVDRLGNEPHQGVGGQDPKQYANAEMGRRFSAAITRRLVKLSQSMPSWDDETRSRFTQAEEALVNRQLELAGKGEVIWTAWRNIGKGVFNEYPKLLEAGDFEGIKALVQHL